MQDYINSYLNETTTIVQNIDKKEIAKAINILLETKKNNGRLFILGVGGSAANASHAVNDFRKIAGIESYTPTDNVSEITARVNDEGWEFVFVRYLETSNLNHNDIVMVFSVGGGSVEKNISVNLVKALEYALKVNVKIIGIVGCDGGYTGKVADACIKIPVNNKKTITPHTESFQAVIWHLIASHPLIQVNPMKWESVNTNN